MSFLFRQESKSRASRAGQELALFPLCTKENTDNGQGGSEQLIPLEIPLAT